ncbi:hypothetical protein [Sinorhizobium fredii]|nr:hypothetical protein [Sinorhizobium fredii]
MPDMSPDMKIWRRNLSDLVTHCLVSELRIRVVAMQRSPFRRRDKWVGAMSGRRGDVAGDNDVFSGMEALKKPLPDFHEDSSASLQDPDAIKKILEEVCHGRMHPSAAEAWAIEYDLEPLQILPREIDIFGPHHVTWSVEMVAAWIVWKDPKIVSRQSAASYSGSRLWVKNDPFARRHPFGPPPPNPKGYTLQSLGRTSIFDHFIAYDGQKYSFNPHSGWQNTLFSHLVIRDIRAVGREDGGKLDDVPIDAWGRGEFVQHCDGTALVVGEKIYTDIEFAASDIRAAIVPANESRIGLRPWKRPVPAFKSQVREDLFALLVARSPKGYSPLPPNERRNLKEKLLEQHPNMKWGDDEDTFRRFLDRVVEDVCERDPRR